MLPRERRRADNPDLMEEDVDEVPCITKVRGGEGGREGGSLGPCIAKMREGGRGGREGRAGASLGLEEERTVPQ